MKDLRTRLLEEIEHAVEYTTLGAHDDAGACLDLVRALLDEIPSPDPETDELLRNVVPDPAVPPDRIIAVDGPTGPRTLTGDLAGVLNWHSRENESNSPDFVLAMYLTRCLEAYETAVRQRDEWHAEPTPAATVRGKVES